MKTTIVINKEVTVRDGERHLTLEFDPEGYLLDFDSNLPYDKNLEDWEFYGKAILEIVKKVK